MMDARGRGRTQHRSHRCLIGGLLFLGYLALGGLGGVTSLAEPRVRGEVGREIRKLEQEVLDPPEAATPSAAEPVITKPEPTRTPGISTDAPSSGRLIHKLDVLGDVSLLEEVTLLDVLTDYIEGAGEGINTLLGIKDEEPRTRAQRAAAFRDKLRQAADRFGLELPEDQSLAKMRQIASGYTLMGLLRKEVEGQRLTMAQADEIVSRYQSTLVGRGYYLASLVALPDRFTEGVLVVEVDEGRMGRMSFYSAVSRDLPPSEKKAYRGRHFSERQLRHKLRDLAYGERFDYFNVYRTLYAVNSHPDLLMDADLRVRRDDTRSPPRRYADMDFYVRENLPIHGVLSIANTGTEATDDWRPSLTLQHLNLTRRDDVLTLNVGPLSEDLRALRSYGVNYYHPYYWRQGGGFTFYGGYSDLDAEEVVEGISVRGRGWFAGLQAMHRIRATSESVMSLGVGATYRFIEDSLILLPTNENEERYLLQERPLTLVPLSLLFSYSSLAADWAHGRNFLTLQWVSNFEGDDSEFDAARSGASPEYHILRAQAARIQPVFGRLVLSTDGKRPERSRDWLLFLKMDGQWASGELVPVEQKTVGGMDTVRGFPERVLQGDHGLSGTLELRTPVILSSFIARVRRARDASDTRTTEGLQFVAFADGGTVWLADEYSDPDHFTIASAGMGLRLMIGQRAQVRFDWGVPLQGKDDAQAVSETEVRSSGYYHLGAQIQF